MIRFCENDKKVTSNKQQDASSFLICMIEWSKEVKDYTKTKSHGITAAFYHELIKDQLM